MITQRKLDEVRLRAEMRAMALFQHWWMNFLAGRMPEPEGMEQYGGWSEEQTGEMGLSIEAEAEDGYGANGGQLV